MPFDRPLELLRLHLQAMGVALPDVMAALRASDAVERASSTSYGWRDILMEQLGVSREEYQLFTDSANVGLLLLYGYPTKFDALTALHGMSLQDFSRRTGVSYDDLVSIIRTQFINPSAILIPRLERLNASFATLQALKFDPSTRGTFIAGLPAGLNAKQYNGNTRTITRPSPTG